MDDFSNPGRPNYFGLQPSTANYIYAGKKPLSSMSPTLVFAKDEEQKDDDSDDDDNDWGDLVLVLGARYVLDVAFEYISMFFCEVLLSLTNQAQSSFSLHTQQKQQQPQRWSQNYQCRLSCLGESFILGHGLVAGHCRSTIA
jgi:Gamma-glutamyltranspeptidase